MDYKKKYENALERAREIIEFYKQPAYAEVYAYAKEDIPSIFPELCEREDEKIKKAIHIYLDWLNGKKDYAPKGEYTIIDMLTWLEKQGEKQKTKIDLIMWKPVSEYTGGRVLATNGVDILVGYINSDGDCESEDCEGTLLCGITGFVKIENVLPPKQDEQNSTDSYCKENCKGYQETGKCFADGECKDKRDAGQKPAWSDEDEKNMKQIDSLLYCQCTIHSSMYEKLHNWLKSLKPQPHWKPTEQQLMALRDAIDNNEMESLYNDLKKL